jgi:N-acetylneuraminic acid mutarotase
MNVARSEMPAVAMGGLIYVPGGFGGLRTVEVYDPVKDTWARRAQLPEGRHHLMAAALDGRLYVFGGALQDWAPANNTWAYDPAVDTWTALTPMSESRRAGAAVTLGKVMYVVGGEGGSQALLRYDPQADTWTALAATAEAREHVAAAALVDTAGKEKIYAIGGRWQGIAALNTVEVYDVATDVWSSVATMNDTRSGFGATVVEFGGKPHIAVVGGEILAATGAVALKSVEVYDPVADTWTLIPDLPVTIHGNPLVGLDGKLYMPGGSIRAAAASNPGKLYVYAVQ